MPIQWWIVASHCLLWGQEVREVNNMLFSWITPQDNGFSLTVLSDDFAFSDEVWGTFYVMPKITSQTQTENKTSKNHLAVSALRSSHLWDVGDHLHLHLSGAHDLRRSGVQDLDGDGEQETRSEGHAFSKTLIQVLVLVHESVLTGGTVHVGPSWTQGGKEPWRRWREKKCL